jgi:hypothetical protein
MNKAMNTMKPQMNKLRMKPQSNKPITPEIQIN